MISINSKDTDLVHVREFGNHQHSKSIEEEHWMLVVHHERGNQVPARPTMIVMSMNKDMIMLKK